MPEEPKLAFIACNTNSEHEQQNMEPSVSGAPPLVSAVFQGSPSRMLAASNATQRAPAPGPACQCSSNCHTAARPPPKLTELPAPAAPQAAHPGQSGMTEAQQEQLLRAKYGGLLPKKKLGVKDAKYFDSADWALAKQKGQQAAAGPNLQPKLEPNQVPARRVSALGDGM